jgi:diamine N-acetyltransferase
MWRYKALKKHEIEPIRDRPVTLRKIDAGTVREICALAVRPDQTHFVAPNAVSIAEAYFSRHAWFRAIYAGDVPVGFVMLEDQPAKGEYFLWRFMIDARYQGLGVGRRALQQVVEHVRTRPHATELLTSVVLEDGGPCGFYQQLGFALTGAMEDGEAVMRLRL